MFKYILMILVFICVPSLAGELVKDTQIIRIGTSSNGVSDDFFITTSGGVGVCANKHIIFKFSNAPSDGFFNRLYSTALVAYSAGEKNVRVVGLDDACTSGSYIDLIKK